MCDLLGKICAINRNHNRKQLFKVMIVKIHLNEK